MDIPSLEFKANFAECVARHRALQAAERGCLIMASIETDDRAIAARIQPLPPLEQIDFASDALAVARHACEAAEIRWAVKSKYPDDSIPFASPRYGTGIIGGMLLGTLEFGSNTSWTMPVGSSLDEALAFPWGKENVWIDRVVDGLQYMADRMRGKCFTFFEGYHCPLEWAAAVRGGELYLDMDLEPDKTHALIRRCDEALMWLYRLLESRVKKVEFGALAHSLWMERCVAFLSDDSAGLIGPRHYAEFGAPYTDAMFGRYGGGFLHFHTMAYHQMDNLSRMRSLTVYNWRPDPKTPAPADILDRLLPGAQRKIVSVGMSPDQIRANIGILAHGRFIVHTVVESRSEQDKIIQLIRERAPIE